MSVIGSLTKTGKAAMFSKTEVDRLILLDDRLITHFRDYSRSVEDDRGRLMIPILDLWRLGSVPSFSTDELQSWMVTAIDEATWARSTYREFPSVAWKAGSRLVIQAPFTLTMSERINTMRASSTTYSMESKCWVVARPDFEDEGLAELLSDYSVVKSPELSSVIEGRSKWRSRLQDHADSAAEGGYRLPEFDTDRTLKPHQSQAVLAQNHLRNTLLADQVGLGKSGEFISAFLSSVQKQLEDDPDCNPYPAVMVTTNSLKSELAEEIIRWKGDAIVEVLWGSQDIDIDDGVEFIVLNVDILAARLESILRADPKAFVADECHMYKNPNAKRTQAALELADHIRANHGEDSLITLASGTPYLNTPSELWSQLRILGKEQIFADYALSRIGTDKHKIWTKSGWRWVKISPQKAFEIRWCDGGLNDYKQWVSGGTSNPAELNGLLLEHCMVRRKKSDVMHPLPELTEKLIQIQMPDDAIDEYLRVEQEFADWMKERAIETAEEEGITVREAVALVYRKLANAEAVMRLTALRQEVARGKIDGIKDWIARFMAGDPEITGGDPTRRKLIVFAHHREIQASLIDDPDLQQHGLVYIRAGEDPQEHKRMFQQDPDARLMICYSGAREGHTLTAAKDVLLAEIPFVPSWIVQMAGRCWARLSEEYDPHEAYVHYAVAPGTIDSLLMAKVKLKKISFDAVIDGEGGSDMDEVDGTDRERADVLMDLMSRGHRSIKIAG